ncbi:MAG: hypothetical protein U0326_31160 [Polyangiales bacterium]
MSYARDEAGYRPGPGERYKVRIEVNGYIEAGIQKIFDVFLGEFSTDLDLPEHLPSAEAGVVYFTRPKVREAYPEWFGAVPMLNASTMSADNVRRTTRALQATFDAAHKTPQPPNLTHPDRVPGVVSHLVRNAAGQLVLGEFHNAPIVGDFSSAMSPSGQIYFVDGGTGTRGRLFPFQTEQNTNDLKVGFHFFEQSPIRAAVPVVLSNDYMIDDELTFGASISELLTPPPLLDTSGFVLRGNRGSSNSTSGNARIVAAPGGKFLAKPAGGSSEWPYEPSGDARTAREVVYGSASMLGIRGPWGFTVENVTFDANGVAPRCITVMDYVGGQHATGFEGCSFLNARSELVHCGAELRSISASAPRETFTVSNTHYWDYNQDLSGLRFLRCRFKTVVHANPDLTLSATGVFFLSGQTLCVEFRGCDFAGPGNPMVHLMSGRASFNQCHFKTSSIPNATVRSAVGDDPTRSIADGVDIFLDAPPQVRGPGDTAPSWGYGVGCVTARDVISESPQFLTTYGASSSQPVNAASQAAVVLQDVQHLVPAGGDRPSVYWGAKHNCPLVLMGCDLPVWRGGNPVRVTHTIGVPIYDLGNRVRGGRELFTFNPGITVAPHLLCVMPW